VRPWPVLLFAAGLLLACGGRDMADDATLRADIQGGRAGAEVTFDGVLQADPVRSGTHEHLVVLAGSGDVLEIDHNVSLATWVPAHQGDQVVVRGQLYLDPGHPGVHCTHAHTSSGCPQSGWIEYGGSYYE